MKLKVVDYTTKEYICKSKVPKIEINNVPFGTKSLALILHDPDAPVKGGWIHYALYDIPPPILPSSTIVLSGKIENNGMYLPKETQVAKNSYGNYRFDGPCPPPGKLHHYTMSLHALNIDSLPTKCKDNFETCIAYIEQYTIESVIDTKVYGISN